MSNDPFPFVVRQSTLNMEPHGKLLLFCIYAKGVHGFLFLKHMGVPKSGPLFLGWFEPPIIWLGSASGFVFRNHQSAGGGGGPN